MIIVRLICYWFVFILLTYPVYKLVRVHIVEEHRIMLVYSWSSVSFILALFMGIENEIWGMLKEKFEKRKK